jgi:hypothetical protein
MPANLRPFVVWLCVASIVAVSVARGSVWVQPHFAPMVLFPLLIGATLGVILSGLVQLTNLHDIRWAIAGTIIIGLVAAMAEHGFYFLDRRTEYIVKALEAGVPEEVLTPMTFSQYMQQQAAADGTQVPLWIVNPILMVAAAVGMVTWYTKTRDDRTQPLSSPDATRSP